MAGERRMKFPRDVLDAIDCLPEERTTMQRQLAFWSERQMEYKNDDLPKHLSPESKTRRDELLKQLEEARKQHPKPPREANVMAVAELSTVAPATFLLDSGSYDKPLNELTPDYPSILRRDQHQSPAFVPPNARSSGRRSALAKWLTAPDNPLTHRVWVNRIWQGHFGRGLVENANDFGVLTPVPIHAELLDWLTSELISHRYDSRHLHRKIVLSATYRQRSNVHPRSAGEVASEQEKQQVPDGLLASYPRQRLSSERIRDAWMTASGTLNDTMFGPGVRPELPPNFGGAAGWKVSEPADRTRRSVYIYAKRNLPYPLMAAFDFPDMHEACGCRSRTTIAPQALMLLNSGPVMDAARQLAARGRREADSAAPNAQIIQAWTIAFGRQPTAAELESAARFLDEQQMIIAKSGASRTGDDANKGQDANAEEAFVDLCHGLLNTNEFLFVD
jgi:hypothetical protein